MTQKQYILVTLAIVAALILGLAVGYITGYSNGVNSWIFTHCMRYPFLLLDPRQYMACHI